MTEQTDLIRERRQQIADDAKCIQCGSTEAECRANRGKDPTAPPWFGCCAQTLSFLPCIHEPDPRAYEQLLKEIEEGHVKAPEDILLEGLSEHRITRSFIRNVMDFDLGVAPVSSDRVEDCHDY